MAVKSASTLPHPPNPIPLHHHRLILQNTPNISHPTTRPLPHPRALDALTLEIQRIFNIMNRKVRHLIRLLRLLATAAANMPARIRAGDGWISFLMLAGAADPRVFYGDVLVGVMFWGRGEGAYGTKPSGPFRLSPFPPSWVGSRGGGCTKSRRRRRGGACPFRSCRGGGGQCI